MTSNVFNFQGMNSADMKSVYKKLVLANHPDRGGDLEKMKTLNAEYAFWYSRAATNEVRDAKTKGNEKAKDYYTRTYNDAFAEALEKKIRELLNNGIYSHEQLTVELCGVFIWISGSFLRESVETRDQLKALQFKYQAGKKAWYWTASESKFQKRTNTDMEYIRATYGSKEIKGNQAVSAD